MMIKILFTAVLFLGLCFDGAVRTPFTTAVDSLLEKYTKMAGIHYSKCLAMSKCDGIRRNISLLDTGRHKLCCESCSCSDTCVEYGNCCPDKLVDLYRTGREWLTHEYTCAIPALRKHLIDVKGYWMIQSCPRQFENITVRKLCLDSSLNNYTSIKDGSPVVAKTGDTEVVYYNIYCAVCNGLSEQNVTPMSVHRLECKEEVFFPESEEKLLKDIGNTKCNVKYYKPMGTILPKCTPLISECNFTGLWPKYDEFIDHACKLYTSPYNSRYRNIFCFLCNEIRAPELICQKNNEINVFTSFAAIIDFAPEEDHKLTSVDKECPGGYFHDVYQMKCQKVHCYFGGQYINDSCVNKNLRNMTGILFKVNIKFTLDEEVVEADLPNISGLFYDSKGILPEIPDDGTVFLICWTGLYYDKTPGSKKVKHFLLETEIYLKTFPALIFVKESLKIDHKRRTYWTENKLMNVSTELYANEINKENSLHSWMLWEKTEFRVCTVQEKTKTPMLIMRRVLTCPLVELQNEKFTWEEQSNDIYVKELDLLLSRTDIIVKDDATLLLCLDKYVSRSAEISIKQNINRTPFFRAAPVGYLTFACMTVSVISLTVTILTYVLFQELRTQPGMYNIFLASALIIAQCLFQFTIDAKEHVQYRTCVLFGLLLHFSWLFVIFWMNVCSLHMARIFKRSMKQLTAYNFKQKTTILYILSVILCSCSFVALNIVISYIQSGGSSFGYADGKLCYISTNLLFLVTFVLPVGAVVMVNCFLFLYTVCRICTVQKVEEASKKKRNFLLVYVRLSTITGLTWVFGFIYMLTKVVAFEYVFAFLNAGQGVFIMLAFVMNKRVLGMYKTMIWKKTSLRRGIENLGIDSTCRT